MGEGLRPWVMKERRKGLAKRGKEKKKRLGEIESKEKVDAYTHHSTAQHTR
jgi:hypothetical protein